MTAIQLAQRTTRFSCAVYDIGCPSAVGANSLGVESRSARGEEWTMTAIQLAERVSGSSREFDAIGGPSAVGASLSGAALLVARSAR
ncbi:hypothetical protein [Nocardia terpenica]|uniref:hypothetical protein n=1 Tax=Nocardia terpenica TaxID=455432 RepID=UPI0012FD9C2B|nr:hypothetical protein [Nocardia terpenica]